MKMMKTVKGYQYCVTANEEVTVTDENGLNLTCPAGEQTYFVATADEVQVVGDGVLTQTRGGIITGGNGGGGEKINPGEVVIGGTLGGVTIADLNTIRSSPIFLNGAELPEGVTLENLTNGMIGGSVNPQYCQLAFGTAKTYAFPYGALFAKYPGKRLPSTINLEKLTVAAYTFVYSELEEVSLSLTALTNQQIGMFMGCFNLAKAEVLTPNLLSGNSMFTNCHSLSHFRGNFPLMTSASSMFNGCKLDLESVQHITSIIPNMTSGSHAITIGVDSAKVSQAQQDAANTIIVGKGWTVTWQRN